MPKKCSYYNSGFCKFVKRGNECKYFHPTETCETPKCDTQTCNKRHPKKCRHGDTCRFQTRCLYNHSKNGNNKSDKHNDEVDNITKQVTNLKSEINLLDKENMRKSTY